MSTSWPQDSHGRVASACVSFGVSHSPRNDGARHSGHSVKRSTRIPGENKFYMQSVENWMDTDTILLKRKRLSIYNKRSGKTEKNRYEENIGSRDGTKIKN